MCSRLSVAHGRGAIDITLRHNFRRAGLALSMQDLVVLLNRQVSGSLLSVQAGTSGVGMGSRNLSQNPSS